MTVPAGLAVDGIRLGLRLSIECQRSDLNAAAVLDSRAGAQVASAPTLALAGVDLDVEPGEVHALVGENGAGKSTLMKVLAGAHPARRGRALRSTARPYRPASPLDARRAGVAMVYQELSLVPHLSVAENILLGEEPARFGLVRAGTMRASGAASGAGRRSATRTSTSTRRVRPPARRRAAARRDRAGRRAARHAAC